MSCRICVELYDAIIFGGGSISLSLIMLWLFLCSFLVYSDRRPAVANSFAMEAASNMRTCYYRSGYDISLPLVPKKNFPGLADVLPGDRKYFLTIKVLSMLPLAEQVNYGNRQYYTLHSLSLESCQYNPIITAWTTIRNTPCLLFQMFAGTLRCSTRLWILLALSMTTCVRLLI